MSVGKFGLGSGRKKEKPKQKVIPDMFAKGAIVWKVQVEDMGTASQVTSPLDLVQHKTKLTSC